MRLRQSQLRHLWQVGLEDHWRLYRRVVRVTTFTIWFLFASSRWWPPTIGGQHAPPTWLVTLVLGLLVMMSAPGRHDEIEHPEHHQVDEGSLSALPTMGLGGVAWP